jgi:hypothetical protein
MRTIIILLISTFRCPLAAWVSIKNFTASITGVFVPPVNLFVRSPYSCVVCHIYSIPQNEQIAHKFSLCRVSMQKLILSAHRIYRKCK